MTPYEIRETVKKISELENKSEAECRKIRADSMRKNGHLTDSIYEYENLLDRKIELRIPIGLEGDIWHNLGSAYMGLFFFREAEKFISASSEFFGRPDVCIVVVNRNVEYFIQVFQRKAGAGTAAGMKQKLRFPVFELPADLFDLLL